MEAVTAFEQNNNHALAEKTTPAYQILDILTPSLIINKRAFLKDMRFHIKKSRAKSQYEFLKVYQFSDYISDTFGYYHDIYQLEQVLANELGLPRHE